MFGRLLRTKSTVKQGESSMVIWVSANSAQLVMTDGTMNSALIEKRWRISNHQFVTLNPGALALSIRKKVLRPIRHTN